MEFFFQYSNSFQNSYWMTTFFIKMFVKLRLLSSFCAFSTNWINFYFKLLSTRKKQQFNDFFPRFSMTTSSFHNEQQKYCYKHTHSYMLLIETLRYVTFFAILHNCTLFSMVSFTHFIETKLFIIFTLL